MTKTFHGRREKSVTRNRLSDLQDIILSSDIDIGLLEYYTEFLNAGGRPTAQMRQKMHEAMDKIREQQNPPAPLINPVQGLIPTASTSLAGSGDHESLSAPSAGTLIPASLPAAVLAPELAKPDKAATQKVSPVDCNSVKNILEAIAPPLANAAASYWQYRETKVLAEAARTQQVISMTGLRRDQYLNAGLSGFKILGDTASVVGSAYLNGAAKGK